MFHSAAPSPDREAYQGDRAAQAADAPWDQDPTLQPLLQDIVSDAAAGGTGARLVVATQPGRPRVLIGVRGNRHPWRALATDILDNGEPRSRHGAIAVPIDGPPGTRCALLVYHDHDPAHPTRGAEQLAHAQAARIELALAHAASRLAATHDAVEALYQALAAHDELTARHAIAVRRLTRTLGLTMDVATATLLEWEWTALLHDVGKIAVPSPLLRKPGALDADEWAVIRRHPSAGERIVRAIPTLRAVGIAVRHHHERWDGGGYPDRLSGCAIPLAARVVALVDAYETMRTGRPYRAPLTRDEARDELRRAAGAQFDPQLLSWLPALTSHKLDL